MISGLNNRTSRKKGVVLLALAMLSGSPVMASSFVINGDFASGLTGWTQSGDISHTHTISELVYSPTSLVTGPGRRHLADG